MKNIYLVGFMATGKTSVGKILADELGLEFVEMDTVIEEREGMPIVEIFSQKGEACFREAESCLLGELASQQNLVVSCGGGLVCNEDNLKVLKASGVLIGLSALASTIYERAKKYSHRPLLNVDDPLAVIDGLLKERSRFYEQADHTIDTEDKSVEDVSAEILSLLDK